MSATPPLAGGATGSALDRRIYQLLLADEDAQRVAEALHSSALTTFLRSELGYRDLLGLSEPPTTIQHPSLWELWEHPLHMHAQLVCEAMGIASVDEQ